jgi:cysteine desulfurase
MVANNEVGTLNPVASIGEITRSRGILLHTDATQAASYIPLDVRHLQVDLLSLSAHKVYGPKGVGALFVSRRNPRVSLKPIMYGGGHEEGLRSGTVNVPGVVGLATALELAAAERGPEGVRLRQLADHMLARLMKEVGGLRRYGHPTERLPNNLNIGFDGIRAKTLVVTLPDLAFSTGSACTTQKAMPSHVLAAMGVQEERVREAVRLGLGRTTTKEDISYSIKRISEVVGRLRAVAVASS